MKIEKAKTKHLKEVRTLYRTSFPRYEQKPFNMILNKRKEDKVDILIIEQNGEVLGMLINSVTQKAVLVDYFALKTEHQNKGLGSYALQMLFQMYRDKNILCEIESTKIKCQDKDLRLRRKKFYLKNGLAETGIDVNIHGVEAELLALNDVGFKEYLEIYNSTYGLEYSEMIKQSFNHFGNLLE